jgi:hypothetical protein
MRGLYLERAATASVQILSISSVIIPFDSEQRRYLQASKKSVAWKLSQWYPWRVLYYWIKRSKVLWKSTGVSKKYITSIFSVEEVLVACFMLVSFLASSSALQKEAICSS